MALTNVGHRLNVLNFKAASRGLYLILLQIIANKDNYMIHMLQKDFFHFLKYMHIIDLTCRFYFFLSLLAKHSRLGIPG